MPFNAAEIRLLCALPVLESIPPRVVRDAISERGDCQLTLRPDEVFITAGLPASGWYLIPDLPLLARHVCPGGCAFGPRPADAPEARP